MALQVNSLEVVNVALSWPWLKKSERDSKFLLIWVRLDDLKDSVSVDDTRVWSRTTDKKAMATWWTYYCIENSVTATLGPEINPAYLPICLTEILTMNHAHYFWDTFAMQWRTEGSGSGGDVTPDFHRSLYGGGHPIQKLILEDNYQWRGGASN